MHLLDDGFQHRRLARDFDIVMVNPHDTRDTLLPVGRLREPLSSLIRADAIVLTNDARCDGLLLAPYLVWRVWRDVVIPAELSGPCFAFCGIARPANFFNQLRAAGVTLAGTRSFGDHHAYTESDVRKLLELRKRSGGEAFVTTEKDAINLQSHLTELAPLHVVPVRMELQNAESAMSAMLARIAVLNRGSA
jgi:tetraacyldisaccharide 4'-kinase